MVRAIGATALDHAYLKQWSAAMQLDSVLREFPALNES